MSRALWLADILADEFRGAHGFQVDVVEGWQDRGRPALYPKGIMNHHTGRGSYNALLNYMAYNAPYPPLCNIATSRPDNGIVRVTVVASGKANHAGRGYVDWTGKDRGNNYSIGFENQNDGAQEWPEQQNEAIARANAAILKYLDLGVDRLVDHKTYAPTRKVDRVHVDLDHWRNYVNSFLEEKEDRRYQMLIYGKRGTPDYNVATAGVDMANKGVASSNLNEAKSAVARDELVVAVGGPAVRDLGFTSTKGRVTVIGNKVAVHGRSGLETMKLLATYLGG